ncbi:dethiobiotin synthetase [Nonomuraea soli]|uniref:ATP-dependent dethiobiotin synthetase BioD n=1 Tax=Nonomuraea soli TaxID=1032476 RepID=A0A7W0CN76_9ACTN|nr:dethiobiotin synthase [Nonomuraea soli]MBA2894267.1 dethiobiotin synthetase [Nonomuraea soli]
MSVLVVTGTDTGVGKTIVTAAIAALAYDRGSSVAVVKPAQTGVGPTEAGDLDEVRRLSGVTTTFEFARFPDPLSPAAAARVSGMPPVSLASAARRIEELRESNQLVLVEGAGGLLVRFDEDGATLADLAKRLGAQVLVVTRAALGTLNHTALTLEAMAHRGLDLAGLVIGEWPVEPGLAERCNVADLEMLAARPLAGVLPAGASRCGTGALPAATVGSGGAVPPDRAGSPDRAVPPDGAGSPHGAGSPDRAGSPDKAGSPDGAAGSAVGASGGSGVGGGESGAPVSRPATCADFTTLARRSLAPSLGGVFDPAAFRRTLKLTG